MSDSIKRLDFMALGTKCVIAIPESLGPSGPMGIAMEQLALLESLASGFNPRSEVRKLSDHSGGRPQVASAELIEIVEIAKLAGSITGGMCDFTVGAEVFKLGLRDRRGLFDPLGQVLGDEASAGPKLVATRVPGYEMIHIDREAATITIPSGVRLDLHSVSKAFYADRIAGMISEAFDTAVLVGLGGDIALKQGKDSEPVGFCVEVIAGSSTKPFTQKIIIFEGGLATSGGARPTETDGKEQAHIIDPRTRRPAEAVPLSVSVAAEHAWIANAFSTATVAYGGACNEYAASIGLPSLVVSEGGLISHHAGWPTPGEVGSTCALNADDNHRILEGVLA